MEDLGTEAVDRWLGQCATEELDRRLRRIAAGRCGGGAAEGLDGGLVSPGLRLQQMGSYGIRLGSATRSKLRRSGV